MDWLGTAGGAGLSFRPVLTDCALLLDVRKLANKLCKLEEGSSPLLAILCSKIRVGLENRDWNFLQTWKSG